MSDDRRASRPAPNRSLMPRHLGAHAVAELAIALDPHAARRADLHEGERPALSGHRSSVRSIVSSRSSIPLV